MTRWWRGLRHVHPTAFVHARADVRPDLEMAEYAFVNHECLIMRRVRIGRYTMLAPRVAIIGADHPFDRPGVPTIFSGRPEQPLTVIEEDCWVGYGCVVMQGVRIGRGSIIAANAVVTRDVPPYEIWGGVPARKINDRFPSVDDREIHDRMIEGDVVTPTWAAPL